jgi:hypothetical protein
LTLEGTPTKHLATIAVFPPPSTRLGDHHQILHHRRHSGDDIPDVIKRSDRLDALLAPW